MIGRKCFKYLLNIIVDIVGILTYPATVIEMIKRRLNVKPYSKPSLKKGQAFCEGLGCICIEWSIKPVLINGQFFNLCKKCQALHTKGELIPLCYQEKDS